MLFCLWPDVGECNHGRTFIQDQLLVDLARFKDLTKLADLYHVSTTILLVSLFVVTLVKLVPLLRLEDPPYRSSEEEKPRR